MVITMFNIKSGAAKGLMAAVALATVIGAPASAMAAEGPTTKSTPVTLVGDSSNLTVTVPTVIPFVMTADGVLTSSADAMKIVNGSNFGINVSDVAVEAQDPFTIVADASVSDADNAVDFQFGVEDAKIDAATPSVKAGKYNMGPAGAANALTIVAEGNAKNVKADLSDAQQVASITWTFAAGNVNVHE